MNDEFPQVSLEEAKVIKQASFATGMDCRASASLSSESDFYIYT